MGGENAYLSKLHNFQQGSIYHKNVVINQVHMDSFLSFHINFLFSKQTLSLLR